MNTHHRELADRLAECFAPINEAVATEILARICAEEHFLASYRFEVCTETVRQLTAILALDESLALDFRDVIWANRQSSNAADLVQHAIEIGRCLVLRERLDFALSQVVSPALRQRFARYLNEFDGGLGLQREAFAHGGLARRITRAAGAPIVDGLQLHGLLHVLAAHAPVWEAFRMVVAESYPNKPGAVAIAPENQKE
jgi:hypothetical protein